MSTQHRGWMSGHTRKDLDAGMRKLERQVTKCHKVHAERNFVALAKHLLLLGLILGEVLLVCMEVNRPSTAP